MPITSTPPKTTSRASADGWELGRNAPLPERRLAALVHDYKTTGSHESRDRVIESHLRLVAKVAKRYAGRGASFDDLMAEGAIAMMRALDAFDEQRGISFTAYASAVIEHAVRGAAANERALVRLPGRVRHGLSARQKFEDGFFAQQGRRPTPNEMPRHLRATATTLAGTGAADSRAFARAASLNPTDAPSAGAALADSGQSPAEIAEASDLAHALDSALAKLPPAAARAIYQRFGLSRKPASCSGMVDGSSAASGRGKDSMVAEALHMLRARVEPKDLRQRRRGKAA